DRGATFSVELKTVSTPAGGDGERAGEGHAGKLERGAALPRHRRVLIVDDHQDTCIGMKRMLERRGYEITVAYSAEQAAEKVRSEDFDLLISDIGLPDRSGYDLMREVRSTKPLPGIALSGFGTEQDVNEARDAGFSEHLTKPIARVIIWTAATRRHSSTCVSLTISALYSRELVRALQTRTLAAAVRCRLVLALRGFFQFARKLFHALAHDLARFKFHCRPRWNHKTAAGLIWISANPRLRQLRLEHAEIA
ncbi:MAG: hypothetical protein DMF09_00830, partial [Verrucomicrobia bacterium]